MDGAVSLRATLVNADEAGTQPALTRMSAVSQLKCAWEDDLPFFLWQVESSDTARAFLGKFDTSQTEHHRVSPRFGTGDLRLYMLSWAAGHALSETLRVEHLFYQWCKLDDTSAEASHRVVSCDGSRRTHASQAWVSAALRLQQNLSLWESLQTPTR